MYFPTRQEGSISYNNEAPKQYTGGFWFDIGNFAETLESNRLGLLCTGRRVPLPDRQNYS